MERWGDLFSPRQALALTTLVRLVRDAGKRMKAGAVRPSSSESVNVDVALTGAAAGHLASARTKARHANFLAEANEEPPRTVDHPFPPGLAEAVLTCLTMIVGRQADYGSALCRWVPAGEFIGNTFGRQAIGMIWDFAEVPPGSSATGGFSGAVDWVSNVLDVNASLGWVAGHVEQASATEHPLPDDSVDMIITDPPYYDAVPYAYLSDFFYVWFRRVLADAHPGLFRDSGVPKEQEIVVDRPHQLSRSSKDISFYERELARAFAEGRRVVRPEGVGCIVFASKSTASWEAILKAVIEAGWIVTGSWPIDTEMEARVAAQGQARLGSSVHIVVRPRETWSGAVDDGEVGEWRMVLEQLPKRIREWMPRLEAEGVVGADAIFACLGPALEIYSRYSRVERASGESVLLPDYLEHVWSTVSTEALSLIFKDADAAGLEPDARLTAMWLWTLSATKIQNGAKNGDDKEPEADPSVDDEGGGTSVKTTRGFLLEFDAARKIAQGLGVHLERCQSFVEIKGETARLLSVVERVGYLFDKGTALESRSSESRVKGKKKRQIQPTLFQTMEEVKAEIDTAEAEASGKLAAARPGATILDRVHQAMLLFSTGRGEALRRFLVDDGVGKDGRFWRLADSLNKLYPASSEERRWVEGVLARKKGLGLQG
jgi:adenine-specific DNA methylase